MSDKLSRVISTVDPNKIRKPRAFISHQIQSVIIFMHFGSLSDFTVSRMGVERISKSLRMPYMTVRAVIERFKSNGYQIISHKNKCGRKKNQVPQNIMDYL
jgi:hypothetical protein